MIDERKNVQTTLLAPTASAAGPCPTLIQISRTPGIGSLPRTIASPDHPNPCIIVQVMVRTNSDGRTHIHRTKIVTTMSRLPASGLDKNCFLFEGGEGKGGLASVNEFV